MARTPGTFFYPGWIATLICGLVLVGCVPAANQSPDTNPDNPTTPAGPTQPGDDPEKKPDSPSGPAEPAAPALAASEQEKYDAALFEAMSLLGERKYSEALVALESAKAIKETLQIEREIEKAKVLISRQAAADKTADDIQTILDQGDAEKAAELAAAALLEYGGCEAADRLVRLKRQADTLAAAQLGDNKARHERFVKEGRAAVKEQNLRTAAIAFEQALQFGEDQALAKELDELRGKLDAYDQNRERAAKLRKDPANLEEAIEAYKEAAKAWDTAEVRQDIDECELAIQTRRERLGIVEFELRGDVGIPLAGRTVADELLSGFKTKYDLVERSDVQRVIEELKLEPDDIQVQDESRAEVGRIAKVRYLVLGSITRIGQLSVHARIIDLKTGLLVQTARVTAADGDDLFQKLPELANLLMMTDEQRLAYEEEQAKKAAPLPKPVDASDPLPPAPAIPGEGIPVPPPLVMDHFAPPDEGGLQVEDFDRLPRFREGEPLDEPVIVLEREERIKQQMLLVALERGDNLFRRGRYREAYIQYEFALSLAPHDEGVVLRVTRCRPLLPPPVVIIIAPPPPPPRIAILDFSVFGRARVVPPWLGAWAADHIADYFSPPFEVVDRAELYWYMGRMGLTRRDLLIDPSARRWLARALNIKFFVFGSIRETASFNVTTHLIDAQYGFEYGWAKVHVHDRWELKLRLRELARVTLMDPRERDRYYRDHDDYDDCVRKGRLAFEERNFVLAIEWYAKAGKLRPKSVQIVVLLQDAERRHREVQLELARKADWEKRRLEAEARARRERELAILAEAERQRALRDALNAAEAERRRKRAYNNLITQGDLAFKQGNFVLSIQLFESAVALHRDDDGFRKLAAARAKREEQLRLQAAEEQARRERELRKQREAELARLREQVEKEKKQREDEERAKRAAQDARDKALYERLRDEGEKLLAQKKYDAAITALQNARQVRKTEEIEKLIAAAQKQQAEADAKDQAAKDRLAKKLEEEKRLREAAEAEAQRAKERYESALKLAREAMSAKKYQEARDKFQEAAKIFKTDVALNGIRQAEDAIAREEALAKAEEKKQEEDRRRRDNLRNLLAGGKRALEAKKYDDAMRAYQSALHIEPANEEALIGLSKAKTALESESAEAKRKKEEQERLANLKRLTDAGKANMSAKQYEAAVQAFADALKLDPANADLKKLLADAEKARDAAVQDAAEAKKRGERYQKLMADGRLALSTKQYDAAIKAFEEAQKIFPGDKTSEQQLAEAKKAKKDADELLAAEAKKRDEENKRNAELKRLLDETAAFIAAKKLGEAEKSLDAAAKLSPNHPGVLKQRRDLQKAQETAKADADARKKLQADFDSWMKKGRDALAAKKFDEAVDAFARADQLIPTDKNAKDALKTALKAREDAKLAADAEAKAAKIKKVVSDIQAAIRQKRLDDADKNLAELEKLDKDHPQLAPLRKDLDQAKSAASADAKKKADYDAAMKAGADALRKKDYDAAIKAFTDAGKIMPGDKSAADMLKQATDLKAAASADAKKKADYDAAMKAGADALRKKDYDAAIKAFTDAGKIMPGDKSAADMLKQATDLKAAASADAKKKADYDAAMKAGADALRKKDYDAAIKAFTDAGKIIPGDKSAADMLKQATDLKAAASADAKKKADYDAAMKAGADALRKKDYDAAIKAFTDAGKIIPGDKSAADMLKQATDLKAAASADAKKKADYDAAMKAGADALRKKDYDAAIKAFTDAGKIIPGDKSAADMLKQATDAKAAAGSDAKKKADFDDLMKRGRAAMAAKKYDDAVAVFTDATKLFPNDREAQQALREAIKARDDAKKPSKEDEFKQYVDGADDAVKKGRYADAGGAYREALKIKPNDAHAKNGLAFCERMLEGQKALNAKKFKEAVKAFEDALKIQPNNADAMRLLKQAREGK